MKRVRLRSDQKRNLAWLVAAAAALGAAATATILGVRCYRTKLDAEAVRLADVLNLGPGKIVAEVGAGKGQMTLRVARLVRPDGRVHSTESEPKKLPQLRRSVEKSGLENISVIKGSETGTELPSQSCDAIFMRGVYHHFTAPTDMTRSLFRALRPGGTLAVIDFPPRLLLSLWTPKGYRKTGAGMASERNYFGKN